MAQRRGAWSVHASVDTLAVVQRIAADFPALEAAGCRVGIGVATGCDAVFIGCAESLSVEPDRLLPLIMAPDIRDGTIAWSGTLVLNPFEPDGALIDLAHYPRFAAYVASHSARLRARHVAQKSPQAWFRSIDCIDASLTSKPKLLIPDIKGQPHVVYDDGRFYPHHNLYVVTAMAWDLQALQAVLRSPLAHLVIATYATTLRGGFLRFQAQYLRRIHLPVWESVTPVLRAQLRAAAHDTVEACAAAAYDLYSLTTAERDVVHKWWIQQQRGRSAS